MLYKKIARKSLALAGLLAAGLLQSAASFADTYDDAIECAKAKDYVCAFEQLVNFIENKPSERPLVSDKPFSLTGLGNKMSEYLVLAQPSLEPAKTIEYANKAVALLGSQTSDPRAQLYYVPYFILKAEACDASGDRNCFQRNANALCDVVVEQGFSWPRERAANRPVKGRDRAAAIRKACPYKYKDDPRTIALFSKIGEYIASIEYGGNIDNYETLFVPPEKLARMKEQNRWEKAKASIEKRNPSLLVILKHIKDKQPLFENHPSGYSATFDIEDFAGNNGRKNISFVLEEGVWYVR